MDTEIEDVPTTSVPSTERNVVEESSETVKVEVNDEIGSAVPPVKAEENPVTDVKEEITSLAENNGSTIQEASLPVEKKVRKKNWESLTKGLRPTLRPRKVEKEAEGAPTVPKKIKKSSEPKKEHAESADVMLPPELPLAESPSSPDTSASSEMPLLHSEASSSASSESRSEVSRSTKKRRRTHFTPKKRRLYAPQQSAQQGDSAKERTVPSPSIAEGNVNPACPESSATATQANSLSLCLCGKKPQVFVSSNNNPGDLTCQALDSMDDRVVGCCNPLPSTTVGLHRPSQRTPYIMLCALHLQRLLRHNCCPGCGLFCTQGKFIACSSIHQFHKHCARQQACLHCGDPSSLKPIVISFKSKRDPVFLPKPRAGRVGKPAKMSLRRVETREPEEPLPVHLPAEVEHWTPSTEPPDPEKYSTKTLLNAVKSGDSVKLLKLMSAGVNPNHVFTDLKHQTVLHVAASLGHATLVHLLLQAGLSIDLLDADHHSPMSLAIVSGHLDVVKYLVKAGASLILKVDDGMTPLHVAAKQGNVDACAVLLSAPSLPRRYVDSLDDGGWTPLVWASEYNHVEVVRYLLKEGGDPLICDVEQNIALHWAAFGGSMDVVELMLSKGCDLTAVNVHGDTPLHIAARQGKYDTVLLLLARGAKSDVKNVMGESPKDCAPLDSAIFQSLSLNEELSALVSRYMIRGPKILTNDISRGKERNPVQCVNSVDDEIEPRDFVYVSESCFTSRISIDRSIQGMQSCSCEDTCTTGACTCTSISLRAWYDAEGRLSPEFTYNDPPMIFECNQMCGCNRILCQNRVVQNGVTCRFQLFRTASRGWGVKTLTAIPKGTFVCEYIGEVITDSEADHREHDSYLFDLDNRDGETYCIDARKYGNMARFINHLCEPNLIPVHVFVDHQDLRFPRIAFFANRDIPAEAELGYNYGEKFWVIKSKTFFCTCGSEKCMYSEETIQSTLEQYQRKLHEQERA